MSLAPSGRVMTQALELVKGGEYVTTCVQVMD